MRRNSCRSACISCAAWAVCRAGSVPSQEPAVFSQPLVTSRVTRLCTPDSSAQRSSFTPAGTHGDKGYAEQAGSAPSLVRRDGIRLFAIRGYRNMRLTTDRTKSNDGAESTARDWESLGRLVRRRTLQAVAMHFVAMGSTDTRHAHTREHVHESPGTRRRERGRGTQVDSRPPPLKRWATLRNKR